MGVFVVPSHYDHWCTAAVNEFAAAGFHFDTLKMWALQQQRKLMVFLFLQKNKKSIIKALEEISSLSDKELTKFANESYKMSKVFDTKTGQNIM